MLKPTDRVVLVLGILQTTLLTPLDPRAGGLLVVRVCGGCFILQELLEEALLGFTLLSVGVVSVQAAWTWRGEDAGDVGVQLTCCYCSTSFPAYVDALRIHR